VKRTSTTARTEAAPRTSTLDRATLMRLAATEYDRFAALLRALEPEDWARSTECPGWDVREMVSHNLGSAEMAASIREGRRQQKAATRRGGEFRLLTGCEVDILKSGLDFDDELLSELDVVVASLHVPSSDEKENTRRLICAAENKYVHMLGHLTGRLLLEREPYPVNMEAVIDACAATGTWIELNCNPWRFDLDWRHWPYAKSKGVKCVINPDAHRNEHAGFLRLGAGIARKGWLEQKDVVNTLNLKTLLKELKRKRAEM